MPVTSINQVQCKLLGISLMGSADSKKIRDLWDSRFRPGDVIWVEVKPGQCTTAIAENVLQEMKNQGIRTLKEKALLTASFLDLSKELDEIAEKTIDQLAGLPGLLSDSLGCRTPLNLEFGHLGNMAFADKSMLKANAEKVIAINTAHKEERLQLCLTAKPVLGDEDEDWKTAVILMDVLRRQTAPEQLVPVGGDFFPNDDVGMFRYGEYNKELNDRLQAEQDALNRALSCEGADQLAEELQKDFDNIDREIETHFPISGGMMPLPLGLRVTGFLAERLATAGKNRDFNAAAASVMSAIESTEDKMCADILSYYQDDISQAGKRLEDLINRAHVGIQLERDQAKMEQILTQNIANPAYCGQVSLSHRGDNEQQIERQLVAARGKAAKAVKQTLLQAMRDAYSQQTQEHYSAKAAALNGKLNDVQAELAELLSASGLVNLLASGESLPRTCFTPVLAGGATFTAVICRNDDGQTLLNQKGLSGYRIDALRGGLNTIDGAPLKAVQLLFFNGNSDRLDDLIK